MKKLLVFSIAALALIGTPAFAADMAVKAPPIAPASVPTWTGWYAGVNFGVSMGNVKTDINGAPVAVNISAPQLLFPALLSPIQITQAVSSVVVKSATIGSILP